MYEITVNGTDKLPVKLVDSTDRVTEETGITSPTVYYSKAGGVATALSTPTWSQLDATNMPGVYLLTLTTAMTDTAGPLVVTVTKTGCAPATLVCDVKAARLTASDVWSATTRTLSSFGTLASDVWAVATRTLTTVADSSGVTTLLSRIGTPAVSVTAAIAALPQTAAQVSDLAGLATEANATSNKNAVIAAIPAAPDNTSIAAIKAKTDNLPTAPAAVGDLAALATEVNATSNKNAVIAAMPSTAGLATSAELAAAVTDIEGHITTSSAPSAATVALAVESQLADDFAGVSARGAGSSACTLDLTPIASGAEVWLTSDIAGTQVYAGTLVADAQGHVTFLLDAGTTYYRWATKPGVRFTNPQAFVAVAD